MKKLLSTIAILALTSCVVANATESKLENFVNQKMSTLTQKEKDFNSKVEAQKKADAAKKKELEKKQAEQKKANEAKKKEIKAKHEANKKAVENEISAWKKLFSNN